jgi:hypothetical protein
MKPNKEFTKWVLPLLLIVLLSSISSCQIIARLEPEYYQENTVYYKEGAFAIDPGTILESLAQEKIDVFSPLISTPETTTQSSAGAVKWSQANYLQITQAFHKFFWGEPIEGWTIDQLFFRLDCKDVIVGPQIFSITLYKIIHIREEESRFVHYIYIKPSENRISWDEYEKYPKRAS